jgi:pyruvate,water dikinase
LMRESMNILEEAYRRPVDVEFAGELIATHPTPQARIAILQCRTLSRRQDGRKADIPQDIAEEDTLFTANQQVPQGCVDDIRYVVYVDPHAYSHITEPHIRIEIGQVVSRLNYALADETFILMGPGRWGTSNILLGVKVNYADIYNTKVLIEVAYSEDGTVPEVSYGTHFFQDLVEANIYPLPLYPDDPSVQYDEDFFLNAPNALTDILPSDKRYASVVRVIDVPAVKDGRRLTLIMDGTEERAVAFFKSDDLPCCDADS